MSRKTDDEDLFAAVLLMPAAERVGFLARACGDDPAVLSRLATLLDAFDDAIDFVRAVPLVSQTFVEEIRAYRVLRELGEGGCGIAYLAEQLAPVKRQVAIKVIKPGMDTKAVVDRFDAERQLLALMDHPNVAKVYDAGSTAAGRPYFVMELIRGISITEYCDLLRLSIAERLQLFIQVCHAIQHAHQNGVMHRDIKPSNVLVTMHDGLPLVKVIDFGIAKATQGPLSQHTFHTALEQFIGTPAYISPEQTELTQRNVDTRSDIYSLGVLLYELLTGCTPLDTDELMRSSAEEMRRRIREDEPLTPSAKLRALRRPLRDVQGDLDWIAMRCLEKEPSRRYQTVNDLLQDVQRHLQHEPVLARPPDVVYTIRRFARRNRAACIGALATVIVVIAFVVNMSIQSQRVAVERDRAEQQAEAARRTTEEVLKSLAATDPFLRFDSETTDRDVLDQLGRSVTAELVNPTAAQARLLEAVGLAHRRRGDLLQAIEYLRKAVAIHTGLPQPDRAATLNAMAELGMAFRMADQLTESWQTLIAAEALAQRSGLERSPAYAKLLLSRGRHFSYVGRLDEAARDLEASLSLCRELPGDNRLAISDALLSLHTLWDDMDEPDKAEAALQESAAILASAVPPSHPDRVTLATRQAASLMRRNRFPEAAQLLKRALPEYEQLFGRNNWRVAVLLGMQSDVSEALVQLEDAESQAREAVSVSQSSSGYPVISTAYHRTKLAHLLKLRAKYNEAEDEVRQALAVLAADAAADNPYTASAEYLLGEILLATDRCAEAESVLSASVNRWNSGGFPAWRAARSTSALGEAMYRQGKIAQGEQYMSESFRTLSTDPKAEPDAVRTAWARVERYLQGRQLTSDAHGMGTPADGTD